MKRETVFYWVLGLLIALGLGCTDRGGPSGPAYRASDVSGAAFGRDFRLADHNGRIRTLGDFRGKVVLLSFGYTRCPDVCPTTLAELAGLMGRLGGEAERVQVLFVTLDPERDTPAQLAKYIPFFHPGFLGLRGDAAATAATAGEFRVAYQKQDTGSAAGYSLDHSTGIYAFDPDGRLRLRIDYNSPLDDVVHDVRLLLGGKARAS